MGLLEFIPNNLLQHRRLSNESLTAAGGSIPPAGDIFFVFFFFSLAPVVSHPFFRPFTSSMLSLSSVPFLFPFLPFFFLLFTAHIFV